MLTLKLGGNMVLKQYTFFKNLTWRRIMFYASVFNKFYIFKPVTSRARNSEIYLIGLGFLGVSSEDYDELVEMKEDDSSMPISLYNIAEKIFGGQEIYLNKLVTEFYSTSDRSHLRRIQVRESREWLKRYPIQPLNDKTMLL